MVVAMMIAKASSINVWGRALGVSLDICRYAFFTQRASRESRGSRWLTGRRNINISPALVGAYQGSKARDARVFFELRYTLALDTEPYATDPLVGVPPSIVAGHNVSLKGGAELPLSSKTSFVFSSEVDGATFWRPDTVGRKFSTMRARAGMKDVTLYGLRHQAASTMIDAGVDAKTASDRLGNSVATILSTYTRGRTAADVAAANLLGGLYD